MVTASMSASPRGLALMLGWRRLLLALGVSSLVGLVISPSFVNISSASVMAREIPVGLAALIAFGLFEQWPARLPSWTRRRALQVIGLAVAGPLAGLGVAWGLTS